jgi:hypothetical protein
MEMKRKALAKAADMTPSLSTPSWLNNRGLMEWLHSL